MSEAAKQRFFKLLALIQSGNLSMAETAIGTALQTTPKDGNILILAAQLAEARKEPDKAISFYQRALNIQPTRLDAHVNMARILANKKRGGEAIDLLTKAAKHHPEHPEIEGALARIHQTMGHLLNAAAHWKAVLSKQPNHAIARGQFHFSCRQICDWSEEADPTKEFTPQVATVLFDDPAIQKKFAESFCQKQFASIKPLSTPPVWDHAIKRIGYLSSDFHAHATSWLMAELFTLHDRTCFEVFVYSYGVEDNSPIRAHLRQESDHFIELNALTPTQCAERIRADEIDILIDLKGHTQGGRLDILAYRPAPIQLHWLGFPATTGTSFIDGFIGDNVTIPQSEERFFTERIYRVPHSYQINNRQKQIGSPLSKQEYGIAEDAFVLACFNQTYKITPTLFNVWCNILHENPKAILWLFESNSTAPDNLRKEAEKRGINPDRLIFAKPVDLMDHLARYTRVDLVLDTFPVGGHTTTSDALWVGTPVVTLAGQSFVSRVAASVLTAAELSQLVTNNLEEYHKLVTNLMNDKEKLDSIRTHLTSKRLSLPLFDTPLFVKDFEALLLDMR